MCVCGNVYVCGDVCVCVCGDVCVYCFKFSSSPYFPFFKTMLNTEKSNSQNRNNTRGKKKLKMLSIEERSVGNLCSHRLAFLLCRAMVIQPRICFEVVVEE